MSAFRKTGLVPFNPEEVLPATLQELPHNSEIEKVKSREERKNLRNIKLLLTDIDKQTVESLSESQLRTRKYVIPASGAAITEIEFLECLKKNSKPKEGANKKREQENSKPKESFSRKRTQENKKKANTVTKKRKVDKVKSNNKNCINGIHQQDSQEPGPSNVKLDGWITFYDSTSDDNNEDDDIPCIVCGYFTPPDFRKSVALELLNWAKCDECHGLVHLKYCTPVRNVAHGENSKCPKC